MKFKRLFAVALIVFAVQLLCVSGCAFSVSQGCTNTIETANSNTEVRYATVNAGSHFSSGNDLDVFVDGPEYISANRVELLGALAENRRVLVRGADKGLLQTFLSGDELWSVESSSAAPSLQEETGGQSLWGSMLLPWEGSVKIVEMYVSSPVDDIMLERILSYSFSYDFSNLLPYGASSETDDYTLADSDIQMFYRERLTITISAELWLYDKNPIQSGATVHYGYAVIDVSEPISTSEGQYITNCVEVQLMGNSTAKVSDYTPPDQTVDPGVTISLGLPWTIGASFDIGALRTSIEKFSGGLGQQHVALRYTPVNFLGMDNPTTEAMDCRLATKFTSLEGDPNHSCSATVWVDTYLNNAITGMYESPKTETATVSLHASD